MQTSERIKLIVHKVHEWIGLRTGSLEGAIEKTVGNGLFPLVDIRYAVQCLGKRVGERVLSEWAKKAGIPEEVTGEQKIVCLHAGNLPLVGFQETLACLIAGVRYYGKISRKDPYLLPAFLQLFRDTPLSENIHTEMLLESYDNLDADAVIFSGSADSIPEIKSVIEQKQIAKNKARFLTRTARFSMAYMDKLTDKTGPRLAEAVLRYNGRGCRSVVVIVSPLLLNDVAGKLSDYFEAYWTLNPTWKEVSSLNRYHYAYNRAIGRDQLQLEHLIVEQGDPVLDNEDVIYWVPGDLNTVQRLAVSFGSELQSIYMNGRKKHIKVRSGRIESLADAQCPPITWRPDGVDILAWLRAGLTTGAGTDEII